MNVSVIETDKIIVGTNDVSYTPPDQSPTGTAVLNGPVYVGKTGASPGYEAVLNITSNSASQDSSDQQPACSASLAMKSDGNVSIAGDGKTPNGLEVTMGAAHAATFTGGTPDAVVVIGDMFVSGAVDCGNKGKLAARFSSADGRPKPFDIQHPTKGKGHRLRYACIEGPEVGVYHRGRLKESNVIELPYYWKDLVDENSITVQLQPIGSNQNLVIQEFNNEFIVIAEDSTNTDLITDLSTIDCFYHVYGERKDINPLIVEYEGETWQDYPDPNFDPNKVDEDKRTYTDPRFAGPPNTHTV
tara:strand:- start:380 stop:1282 length:903 start_codon:yes stop_codon:yes gene_type:complete